MNSIFLLKNEIQHYGWGNKTALNELFGIANPTDEPQAEIWMGAHPKAPSMVLTGDSQTSLLDAINESPVSILGEKVADDFDNKLPFLFKVLNAGEPLSIQSHPSLAQAKQGFILENQAGIELSAFNRNYKDDNHKPELICALTPFKAMNGFRQLPELIALLEKISCDVLSKPLAQFKQDATREGLKQFYTWMMSLEGDDVIALTNAAIEAANANPEDNAFATLLNLNSFYPNDIGIMCAVMLNVVELEPGQAMYLDAGELHAYLHGVGMEIMANSDNVLRGGLTPKHVDVPELLKTLSFNHGDVEILTPYATDNTSERMYRTPVSEFDFSVIELDGSQEGDYPVSSVEILFCAQGSGTIRFASGEQAIKVGESVVVPADVKAYQLSGELKVFKASVPK